MRFQYFESPEDSSAVWRYWVACNCTEEVEGRQELQVDVIESPFPLRVGGTTDFWDAYKRRK